MPVDRDGVPYNYMIWNGYVLSCEEASLPLAMSYLFER